MLLAIIAVVAFAVRVYEPWSLVFTPTHVNMLDGDGWYHLRAIESFVRNFPHHLTFDPYAIPGGMWVAMAPLFDIIAGTIALVMGLGSPSEALIVRVAVFLPPVFGVLSVLLVYGAARELGGPRAGLLAAALAAILPGHFLDRTLLGFVDHHALEACLSTATLYLLLRALRPGASGRLRALAGALAGLTLGAFALTWTSAAFLFAIVGAAVAVAEFGAFATGKVDGRAAALAGTAGLVALAIVLALQHPGLFRRDMQVLAAASLAAIGLGLTAARILVTRAGWNPRIVPVGGTALLVATYIALPFINPQLAGDVGTDLLRFQPSADRMQVSEARPLMLFSGVWAFQPVWLLFRAGFIVGLVGVVVMTARLVRRWDLPAAVVVVWCLAMYLATYGQNRFGYYLVPIAAVIGGWLCALAIDTGRRLGTWPRSAAVVAVAALVFAPSLVPAVWTTGRPAGMSASWAQALRWLRDQTPEPFAQPDYYRARYQPPGLAPAYTIMNWWDYGYWIAQTSRRVPVANPTQAGAGVAGSFFIAQTEDEAMAVLDATRSRFVVADEQLAYVPAADGGLSGKFESLAAFAGQPRDRFFDGYILPDGRGGSTVVFLFSEAYYRSMAFRLVAASGEARRPLASTVVSWAELRRPDGGTARQVLNIRDFSSHEAAQVYLSGLGPGRHEIVGRNPMNTAVPLEPLTRLRRVYATPAPGFFSRGVVQIFERVVW